MSDELRRLPSAIGQIAHQIAQQAMAQGATAVVLAGSHARGDAHVESDIDIYAIGDGPDYRLEQYGDHLVSMSWSTEQESHEAFRRPSRVGAVIPGWRNALILDDPNGVAAALRENADAWDWDSIGQEPLDRWVAEEVTGFAEEARKLTASLHTGNLWVSSVQRSILGLRLAIPLSVHYRILYESENRLWQMVADTAGPAWAHAQTCALGQTGADHEAACRAALDLFRIAGETVWPLLDNRQRGVVGHAMALASSG
jgi:hypothetical protein